MKEIWQGVKIDWNNTKYGIIGKILYLITLSISVILCPFFWLCNYIQMVMVAIINYGGIIVNQIDRKLPNVFGDLLCGISLLFIGLINTIDIISAMGMKLYLLIVKKLFSIVLKVKEE